MDSNLSEDHQLLSNTLNRFLGDNYDIEKRNEAGFTAPYHLQDMWNGLAELGVIGALVSEEKGGFGGSAEDISVVFEELGRSLCVEPMLGTLLALRVLSDHGQDERVEQIISGESRAALAVYEPNMSCDLSAMEATAVEQDGVWRLNGRKSAIYGAPGSDFVVVAAKTESGTGLFFLENPVLICAAMVDGGGVADLVMENTAAECLALDAETSLTSALDLGRIALCAEAVGAMSALQDLTVDYLKQRKQFGTTLSSFQALQHRAVNMQIEIEQCRSIVISAVGQFGQPGGERNVSMAKNLIGRAGRLMSEESIQLHGGIGMTWEYPGAHFAKRLVMIDHQLGDQNDHAMRLIATGAKQLVD